MEDSTLTTIEFLRARLLSERSASKMAKQKADELAQRVVELEKQLISVSLERKKAEKESEEVLTILENNGISEFMEALDSSSDEEQILVESGQHTTNSSKESSTLPIGRSLSWKSNNDNSSSGEKRSTDRARRREGRFLYTSGSSSKPRLGKSCRQIKRMDLRSPADGVDDESLQLYSPANGLDTGSGNISGHYENSPKSSETGLENEAEEDSAECVESDLLEYRSEGTSASVNVNGSDAGLENELGNQTKLIGWYEAEEIAQTEWEEKFREDGSCTPDSCEHGGNQSDITEEKNEVRGNDESADIISSHDKEAKSVLEEAYFNRNQDNLKTVSTRSIHATPCLDTGYSGDLRSNSMPFNKSPTSFPDYSKIVDLRSIAKGSQKNEEWSSHNSSCGSSSGRQVQRCISYYEGNTSREGTLRSVHKRQHKNEEWSSYTPPGGSSSGHQVQRFASCTQGDTYRGRSLRSIQKPQEKNEDMSPYTSPCGSSHSHQVHKGGYSYRGVTSGGGQKHNQPMQQCETHTNLVSVLDELQRAKLSLKHELIRLPSSALAVCPPTLVEYTGYSHLPTLTTGNSMEIIPLGCASLFRVPTDLRGSPGPTEPLGKLGNCPTAS